VTARARAPGAARFVGREAELRILRAEIDAALAGEGRIAYLLGEPGIGKTRTATALAGEAAERGACVVWGRCHEVEGAPAYWPWVQALTAASEALTADAAAELREVLPALRAETQALAGDAAPEQARFALFLRVAGALARATRARPLVVALDDLHWADAGSLRLLEFLGRELAPLPLLVIATLREGESRGGDETSSVVSSLMRLGRCVRLAGLARDAVAALLSDRLDSAPAGGVVEQVLGVTDGNPYLVIELAHLLAAGAAPFGDGRGRPPVPPGARELLRRRLAPLTAPALRSLRAAAVIGREFELTPLARMLGEPEPALLEALSAPLALGLIREVPGSLQRFAFAHALLRETLYEDLAKAERTALHAACADVLEALGADRDERLPALAYHCFEAAHAGDPARAIRYGCAAGERALARLAFEEAIAHFERARAALAGATEDDAWRWRVLAGLGQALHGTGEHARSGDAFQEAMAAARIAGSEPFGDSVLRFARARPEVGVLDSAMNALLEEALAGLPADPTPLRALLLARLAAGLQLEPGSRQRVRGLSDQAVAIARRLGDPGILGFVLSRRIVTLVGPDDLAERIATTDEILATPGIPPGVELDALTSRISVRAECGDRAGLDHAIAVYEQKASASRHPVAKWGMARFRTGLALLEGRFDEAEALAQEALRLGNQVLTHSPFLEYAQQIFTLRGWQGRLAEVGPVLEAGVEKTQVIPAWRCALAEYYKISGRELEAQREFEALAANDFEDLPRDGVWIMGLMLLASLCSQLGDQRRAGIIYRLLSPYRGVLAVGRPLVVVMAPVDQRLGTLASLLERFEEANAHFADALAIAERMRALPWQAEIRYERALLLGRRAARGDRERALALLDESAEIARGVGMQLLLGWIEAAREQVDQPVARAVAVGSRAARGNEPAGARVVSLVPRSAAAPAAAPARPAERTGTFRRQGGMWTLAFEGRTTHLRHMLGLAHLARLLAEPGREIHVADLVGSAYAGVRDEGPGRAAPRGDAGAQLDARARAEYEERLRDAREELAEAERLNDRGRSEGLAAEIELLATELSRGYGLGGRQRRAGSAQERARLAVTRAIKYAIDKIETHDPALAEHLHRSVRTGAFCVYAPATRDRVSWTP
jgi:tetratricopeptide (TPR) repeat protein